MQIDQIKRAKQLAANFVIQASDVLKTEVKGASYTHLTAGPKLSGSFRRLSLDLTRALADMRKP